jgi:hypothetical protein
MSSGRFEGNGRDLAVSEARRRCIRDLVGEVGVLGNPR